MNSKTVKITVVGRVQGVFFRKFTQIKARELKLVGFVKNMPNGDVFIVAAGTEEKIDSLLAWCHVGSPLSNVSKVVHEFVSDSILETDFTIK